MTRRKLTLGSLFDGSGGFPLAGILNGIEPRWTAEIEPFPSRVTAARFPDIPNHGDVTKIDGGKIEPVDIITFGSPCQDLSVAGKQAGIHDGERSNLFFEAIRIIKEMRKADEDNGRADEHIRPRYAVWENVPGAFSSNKGEDFRAVLEAFASVHEDGLYIPRPKKWNHAGCMVGNGWSAAWRVYDAQYWGVPQRRKRIYLIADFASERAGEILFERESLCGDSSESGEAREGTAAYAERGVGGSCFNESGIGYWMPGFGCLRAEGENRPCRPGHCVVLPAKVNCLNPWDVQSKHIMTPGGTSEALCSGEKRWGALPPNICYPTNADQSVANEVKCYALDSLSSNSMKSKNPHSGFHEEQIAKTLDTRLDPTCNQGGNAIVERVSDGVKCLNPWDSQMIRQYGIDGKAPSLSANTGGGQQRWGVCYPAVSAFMGGQGAKARSIAYCDDGTTPTLKSAPSGGNTVPDVCYPADAEGSAGGNCIAFKERAGKPGGGKGILPAEERAFTLATNTDQSVCYAVEGNTVDRESRKNGRGYCENVSPTLNTQDRHAVTYAIEGNGARGSHRGNGYSETDQMYTLNTIERHAVVFQQNQRDEVRDMGDKAGALTAESGMHNQNFCCFRQTSFGGYDEGVGTLRASGGDNGGGTESIVVLNDQGGAVMDTPDIPGALRAQKRRHEPIVCMRNREKGNGTEEPG